MRFTTRPELAGTFGMVASTHWLASAVGMKLLETGGTAADASVAMGFVLHVVEPHLNGPLGEVPILVKPADATAPSVICGQGTAPARATIAHYRDERLYLVPGSGMLAAVVPGAFDALMLLLREHVRLSLREVLEPAMHYAEAGHPILPSVALEIAGMAEVFQTEWPSSAAVWLPDGSAPKPGALFGNADLAATWRRLLAEAEAADGRDAQIAAARRVFYDGFVAEAIDGYLRDACVMDATGHRRKGVLTGADMAAWRASVEPAVSVEFDGWTIWKPGIWSQGPVQLQALRMLADDDLSQPDERFVHLVTEALKHGFADREAYYGDPLHCDLPLDLLLSDDYARRRRAEFGAAATDPRPGDLPGLEHWAEAGLQRRTMPWHSGTGIGTGEPTMAHLTEKRGDTVHLDVIDRWGNAVSATPSGGWLKSSPVIPGLGMPLNTRAQMFWLDDGLPTSLAPGRRPRTTLSPSLATGPGAEVLCYGTPGGDQQDQWQLIFLLRHLRQGLNLQEAIDAPLFHTGHLQSSFYPHEFRPGQLVIEPSAGDAVLAALRERGHDIHVAAPWSVGRLTAVARGPDGILTGAATPRLMQAYAIGR